MNIHETDQHICAEDVPLKGVPFNATHPLELRPSLAHGFIYGIKSRGGLRCGEDVMGHELDRLPRWAQNRIRKLEADVASAKTELASALGQRPTKIEVDPYRLDIRSGDDHPTYLRESAYVRYTVPGGSIDVRLADSGDVEIYGNADSIGGFPYHTPRIECRCSSPLSTSRRHCPQSARRREQGMSRPILKRRKYPKVAPGAPYAWIVAHKDYAGDDCIEWPFCRNQEGRANMHRSKDRHAARVMCRLVHGDPPTPKHQAAHSCGNGHKACMNPRHLSWKTNSENQLDRRKHGTSTKHFGKAPKLTYAQAVEIRALKGKMSGPAVGKLYGVHANNIYFIWNGKTFKSPQASSVEKSVSSIVNR